MHVKSVSSLVVFVAIFGLVFDANAASATSSVKFSESRSHAVKKIKFIGPKEFPTVKCSWVVTMAIPGFDPASVLATDEFQFHMFDEKGAIIQGSIDLSMKPGDDSAFTPGAKIAKHVYAPSPFPGKKGKPVTTHQLAFAPGKVVFTFTSLVADEEYIVDDYVNVSVSNNNRPEGKGTYTNNAKVTATFKGNTLQIDSVPFSVSYSNKPVGELWAGSAKMSGGATK